MENVNVNGATEAASVGEAARDAEAGEPPAAVSPLEMLGGLLNEVVNDPEKLKALTSSLGNGLGETFRRHSTTIFTGLALAGGVAAVALHSTMASRDVGRAIEEIERLLARTLRTLKSGKTPVIDSLILPGVAKERPIGALEKLVLEGQAALLEELLHNLTCHIYPHLDAASEEAEAEEAEEVGAKVDAADADASKGE